MESEVSSALRELRHGWVETEVESANFGDRRLDKRYAKVLDIMSRYPQSPFNQSSECLSEMLGAYRFIDNAKVDVKKLLEPHREQISNRASAESTVLLIQDTTYLDMQDHSKCEDLKPLRIKRLSKALWVHSTLAILPNGLPLGVVDVQFLSGDTSFVDREEKHLNGRLQSERWLDAVDKAQGIFDNKTRKIWLCDREADMYELMEHVHSKGEGYVIRSRYPREIEEGPYYGLQHALLNAPVQFCFEQKVARNFRTPARIAKMTVKYLPASVTVPQYKQQTVSLKFIPGNVVEVLEIDPPVGEDPIHWKLLTNEKVDCLNDALRVVELYKQRWAIEELFKILKSGCRVEKAQFQTTARLSKYITLSLIVAWRIYFLVHVNRLTPEAPAQSVLTASELETLQLLLDDKRLKKGQRRMVITSAKHAITQIARLGGYLNRKHDPTPGIVAIWKGTMVLAFSTMTLLAQRRVANS